MVSADLLQIILDNDIGLLGQEALGNTLNEDQEACQRITNPWAVQDTQCYAYERIDRFFLALYDTSV